MSAPAWTDTDIITIARRRAARESWPTIAADTGDDPTTLKQRWSKNMRSGKVHRVLAAAGLLHLLDGDGDTGRDTIPPESQPQQSASRDIGGDIAAAATGTPNQVIVEVDGDTVRVESPRSGRIRTLDELLAACETDLAAWQVDKHRLNKWEIGAKDPDGNIVVEPLFQVTAWLSRAALSAAALRRQLIEDMAAHAPRYAGVRHTSPRDGERHLAVISLADHHFGSLAWAPESGDSYDVAIAEDLAAEAMTDIVHKVSAWPIERVLFILGNDLLHSDRTIDGKGGTTTRGTVQETDGRWQKVFRIATRASVAAIDMCRAVAPVEVVVKAGNHDTASTFMLGDVVAAWYRLDNTVSVVNDPAPRSYVEYGVNALGIAHGHNEKPEQLPLLMATEAPDMWARTVFRDWLTGHRHRKGVVMSEESGVQIHTMPSLCATDSWHAEQGYRHRRSSEARLYHRDNGPAGHLIFNAKRAA